jgi:hypothetical protein
MSSRIVDYGDSSFSANDQNSKRTEFLKMAAGVYHVRPVGNPISFPKYVEKSGNTWRSAIPEDANDNPIAKNHNATLSNRYAIHIIDRADGQFKIMEAGITVFREFKKYFEYTGINPGQKDGAEFVITVRGQNLTKKYFTKLHERTTLSEAEVALMKDYLEEMGAKTLGEHLLRIFKSTPDAEIEAKLFGDPDEQEQEQEQGTASTTQTEPATPAPAPAPAPAVSAPDLSIGDTSDPVGDELPF